MTDTVRLGAFRRITWMLGTAAVVVTLAACGRDLPNTTFNPHTDFGRAIDDLWNLLLNLGTAVFILVEGLLVFTLVRYRHRPGRAEPEHVHGNTTLEILWTVIPADAPDINTLQCQVTGAHVFQVDGLISDAGTWVAAGVQAEGWYDASTFKEPYRLEGKKTLGLEIAALDEALATL